MSAASVSYEHLAFAGRERSDARELQRKLEWAEGAARLFASGLLGMDVQLSWSLTGPRPVQWTRAADGSLSVHIWLYLHSVRDRSETPEVRLMTLDDYLASFRSGFLHALGRVLYSPNPWSTDRGLSAVAGKKASAPGGDTSARADTEGARPAEDASHPLEWALRRQHPRWRSLPGGVRAELEEPVTRTVIEGLFEELEDARVDGALAGSFAGAPRQLESRRHYLVRRSRSEDPVVALTSLVAYALATPPPYGEAGSEVVALPSELRGPVAWVRDAPGVDGARRLAELVVFDLFPRLLALEGDLQRLAASSGLAEQQGAPSPAWSLSGLRSYCSREQTMDAQPRRGAPGTVIVALPHVGGGEEIFRIDRAFAHRLEPDAPSTGVLKMMAEVYGPRAEEAFAAEAAPLRRALRVNWERRRTGRYRTGRHVGIPNLRRYILADDLRLFQRLEAPESFSYYFHILVDVSYSMFEHNNASKALAVAYGFTDLLRFFKVPVDVTLYSAGVTELFDHQKDSLERFFGADFGYLLSGTLEMEAVAYAKQKAARVSERSKIFVVVTDGTPSVGSLDALGATELEGYYRETFIPWLRRAGIELLAIGVECDPSYHERSVCLTESWDAVQVLTEVLQEMVGEARAHLQELWT